MKYMLFVKQDAEYSGSNTWWNKGEYEAESPEDAIGNAYADMYFVRSRSGSTRRVERVAVTGPGTIWQEYDITMETHAAQIISVEPREFRRDGD